MCWAPTVYRPLRALSQARCLGLTLRLLPWPTTSLQGPEGDRLLNVGATRVSVSPWCLHAYWSLAFVLVSSRCRNKLPWIGWLTAQIYSLTDLEVTSPNSRCLRALIPPKTLGEKCPLLLLASGGSRCSLTMAALLQFLPLSSSDHPLFLCVPIISLL